MEGLHLQEETLSTGRIYIRSSQVVQEGWDFSLVTHQVMY